MLKIHRRLSGAAPENADYARDLSVSYNKLGDLARSGGDPAAARRYYEDGLTIAKRLADAAPENADYARGLSISYDRLGDLARSGGDPAAARRYYEDGLKIRKRLADAAPENADYAPTSQSATSGWVTWRGPVAIRRRPGGTTRTARGTGDCYQTTALNTARTGSISAFQLDQQFGSFGFGSGLSHDFAPVHRLALAFGHACRTIR